MPAPKLNQRQWLAIGAGAVALAGIGAVALVTRGDDEPSAAGSTTAASSSAPSTSAGSSVPGTDTTAPGATTAPPLGSAGPEAATPAPTAATAPPGPTTPPTTGVPPSPTSLVTVPAGTIPVDAPIGFDDVGDFGTGVTVEVVRLEAVDGVAELPGEISGPAIRVTLRLSNGSDAAVPLSLARVDVTSGPDRVPGLALSEPGGAPFTGDLAAGNEADGVYVFGVPNDRRGQVQVQVLYSVEAPVIVFEGAAPTG